MPKMTRRDLLNGVAGCTVAAAFGCKQEAQKTLTPQQKAPVTIKTLNILLHGLMAVVVNQTSGKKGDHGITLLMPLISDKNHPEMSHRYWFGNMDYANKGTIAVLDQMKSLGPSDICTLTGITQPGPRPSSASFDRAKNLVFDGIPVTCTGCRQFNLPWPDQIQSVAYVNRADNRNLMIETAGCNTGYGQTKELSTICVLTYSKIQPGDQLHITYDLDGADTGWILQPGADPNCTNCANLHIFAEPQKADFQHPIDAFTALMTTIGKDKCLTFDDFSTTKMVPSADTPPNPTGTIDADLVHLEDVFKAGEVANCVLTVSFQ
jgi:hypothetical protein